MLSELDLALVNALQINPRAPWSLIGETLGVSAVTAARRWARLVANGDAWMTAYPGGDLAARMVLAFVEIDCSPGCLRQVSDTVAADEHAASVDYISGRRDLFVHVVATTLTEVSDYVVHRLAVLPGVAGIRTLISPRIFSEGSRWQVRAISQAQRAALSTRSPQQASATAFDELNRALILALGADARASYAELAELLDVSASTVRRRLDALLATGALRLRCEVARSLSPSPVSMTLWLRVPPDRLEAATASLTTLPQVRMCAAVSGPANLLLIVWLRTQTDTVELESALVTRLPWLEIVDRAVILRQVKLMGRVLDGAGRESGRVPLDFWSPVRPRTAVLQHGDEERVGHLDLC
jgi:DNA-binding Lrp family transcriptional regulator